MRAFALLLLIFLAGAFVEGLCAMWVTAVSTKRALRSALMSMAFAAMMLAGIGQALHSWPAAAAWVLGYGAGSYAAVRWL